MRKKFITFSFSLIIVSFLVLLGFSSLPKAKAFKNTDNYVSMSGIGDSTYMYNPYHEDEFYHIPSIFNGQFKGNLVGFNSSVFNYQNYPISLPTEYNFSLVNNKYYDTYISSTYLLNTLDANTILWTTYNGNNFDTAKGYLLGDTINIRFPNHVLRTPNSNANVSTLFFLIAVQCKYNGGNNYNTFEVINTSSVGPFNETQVIDGFTGGGISELNGYSYASFSPFLAFPFLENNFSSNSGNIQVGDIYTYFLPMIINGEFTDTGVFYTLNASNLVNTYEYQRGYSDGYGDGQSTAISDFQSSSEYENILNSEYNRGKNIGLTEGRADASDYSFFSLISAVIDVPLNAFRSMFNFDLLGVNVYNLLTALLTTGLVLAILKMVFL